MTYRVVRREKNPLWDASFNFCTCRMRWWGIVRVVRFRLNRLYTKADTNTCTNSDAYTRTIIRAFHTLQPDILCGAGISVLHLHRSDQPHTDK